MAPLIHIPRGFSLSYQRTVRDSHMSQYAIYNYDPNFGTTNTVEGGGNVAQHFLEQE